MAMRDQLQKLVEEMVDRGILYDDARREFERHFIARALHAERGSVTAASARLGLHRNTLRRKIAEHHLRTAR